MVLLNYEKVIQEKLEEQAKRMSEQRIRAVCLDYDFRDVMIKLYEYCEQINIIEQRMNILAKETQKIKGLKPKLLESEVAKIEQKTKQISSSYSIFLFKQPKFKIGSDESAFYEAVIKLIIIILEKCFSREDFSRLRKQINRLIRTNTFNKKICWEEFVKETRKNPEISKRKRLMVETDFKKFRRSVIHEKSDIRPYVNNRSCFRATLTRSPMVSLLFPTNQYLSFKLSHRNNRKSLNK